MPAVAPDDSLIGFVLADKYRIVRQIGRGGMGIVYEAEHIQLGKRVAIKLILEKYAEDTEAIARFQREALAASRIGNPHIIDVSDIGNAHDGRPFVAMELLTGHPLSQILEMSGPLPTWRAIAIMRQVLRAVGAAHAKGIIHRDLKPDNIFLIGQDDQHDFVKLLDFGISKVVDPDEQVAFTKLTSTGVVMGTPLYMAPEQAMGNPVEAGADIYACGVILYELLAGKPPFEGATYAVLVAKLLTAPPPPLGEVRPGLPLALVNAVHRALEKEPHRRFASAEQFAAALPGDRSPSQLELAGTLDSGMKVARVRQRPRRWPFLAMALALLVGVATAGVLIVTQTKPAEKKPPEPAAAKVDPPPQQAPKPPPSPPVITTGTLAVETSPAGAEISVDKLAYGKSPIVVTLEGGTHHVHVELPGYSVIDYEATVRANERSSVVIPLAKGTAIAQKPTIVHVPIVKKKPPVLPGAGSGVVIEVGPKKPPIDEPVVKKPPQDNPATVPGSKPNPYKPIPQ